MQNTKLWLTVKEFAPFYGKKPSAIYMQIARGRFPFRYRRCNGDSGSILISARDAEVVQPNDGRESQVEKVG
jgi:hypothetical protein